MRPQKITLFIQAPHCQLGEALPIAVQKKSRRTPQAQGVRRLYLAGIMKFETIQPRRTGGAAYSVFEESL